MSPPSTPVAPSAVPSTSASVPTTPQTAEPPGAVLSVAGTGAHPAELGTFDYRGAGSDAPWLPAQTLDDLAVAPGAALGIRLAEGTPIGSWNATVAAAADDQAVVKRVLAEDQTAAPTSEIRIAAPRSGSWVLAVSVRFADGSGSAVYFWQIDVR